MLEEKSFYVDVAEHMQPVTSVDYGVSMVLREIVENVGQTMYRDLTFLIFDLSGIFHMICYPLQIVNTPGHLYFSVSCS